MLYLSLTLDGARGKQCLQNDYARAIFITIRNDDFFFIAFDIDLGRGIVCLEARKLEEIENDVTC